MCTHCKQVKDIVDFCRNKSKQDGYHTECRTCKSELYFLNKEKLFPKEICPCGKNIYKYYLEKHQQTNLHKHMIEKIACKQM